MAPGFGKVEHRFLIEGGGPITITYESRPAGKLNRTAELT